MVNTAGDIVCDTFVAYPKEKQQRPDPQWLGTGVKYNDIKPKFGAQEHAWVLAACRAILDKAGQVVGHALGNDENMLRGIDFGKYAKFDTQEFEEYKQYGKGSRPALRTLAAAVLGR